MCRYVAIPSITGTPGERKVEGFFSDLIGAIPYFQKHPDCYGFYDCPGDSRGRRVCWAMIKGKGRRAVVLLHHYDVVAVEDFRGFASLAFSPDELHEGLEQHLELLTEDARRDLTGGRFIFCHGGCDMKAGGAIQYALLEAYTELDDFNGTVLVLGVPDEENLSAGMRAAVGLLAELKRRYDFDYIMTIDSEPHQRRDPHKGVFSEGSVGKLMPFVYVRGSLAHAGKVFEGLNPALLLAEVVRRTEVNMDLADVVRNEAAPPPTWLYMKDSKEHYDVSMPLSAYGCFSVLTLKQSPAELLEKVRLICEESFTDVAGRLEQSYREYCAARHEEAGRLPWKVCVSSFRELCSEARHDAGEVFASAWQEACARILRELDEGSLDVIRANEKLISVICDYVENMGPRIVYGLVPPYYPSVSNDGFASIRPEAASLCDELIRYARREFDQEYEKECYYTGICDLSYTSIGDPQAERKSITGAMPLFGGWYDIPFEDIREISMGAINIGPWGKDFHKLTERVSEEDLCVRTPRILDHAICRLLG